MKEILICGTIIANKESAARFINRLYRRFDGSMEASVAIGDIEDKLVKAGLITWAEVEAAELA